MIGTAGGDSSGNNRVRRSSDKSLESFYQLAEFKEGKLKPSRRGTAVTRPTENICDDACMTYIL
ncbi:hypothetical protein BW721_01265 [Jeotgalibaca sp. PTS2502]|nr:hypothetical protein BW721_01265 [Jeotgalibaca sp. PTS2502]